MRHSGYAPWVPVRLCSLGAVQAMLPGCHITKGIQGAISQMGLQSARSRRYLMSCVLQVPIWHPLFLPLCGRGEPSTTAVPDGALPHFHQVRISQGLAGSPCLSPSPQQIARMVDGQGRAVAGTCHFWCSARDLACTTGQGRHLRLLEGCQVSLCVLDAGPGSWSSKAWSTSKFRTWRASMRITGELAWDT